jgi:hypothetical protein
MMAADKSAALMRSERARNRLAAAPGRRKRE